jgi:RNA polymerase sigma-70 factor (sigma-E family)
MRGDATERGGVSDGDRLEFEGFAQAELPRLLGFGRALTGSHHDAWDLAQEALARIGLRWSRFERAGNPAAYVRTTMVRLNIDRLRRLRRETPVERIPDYLVVDSAADPVNPWLVAALATLTPKQRTAVVLRYVLDLDHAGIAREMDCAVGTAKSHLSRGLDRLRDYPTTDPLKLDVEGARVDG